MHSSHEGLTLAHDDRYQARLVCQDRLHADIRTLLGRFIQFSQMCSQTRTRMQVVVPSSPVQDGLVLTKAQLIAIVMRGTRDPSTRAPLIHMINNGTIWTKDQLRERGL